MTAQRIWLLVAAAAVAIGLTLTSHARPPEGPIQVRIWKNVMAPMRDGVRLATDVYLPNGETTPPGPFPTILIRHPYGKSRSAAPAEFFTTHGYAVAIQDTRGRYDSEGEFYIYVNEGEDGYDAVEWIAAQPWSSGDVGTYGGSYGAACQNALAVLRPPHLKTMFAYVGTSNYIEDGAGRGGAFALLHNMAYGFRLAQWGKEAQSGDPDAEEEIPTLAALNRANEQLASWLMAAPLKSTSPLSWTPSYARWYADWRAHPTYDDYWKQNGYNFEERHSQYPDIPICFIGGWYDIFKRGTLRNFQGLTGRQGYVHLLVGPWTHSTGRTYAGDVDFGPEVKMTLRKKAVKWFDQFLKGKDLDLERQPPVRYFVMGAESAKRNEKGRLQSGGAWKSSGTWPPAGSRQLRLYLHPDGSLRRESPQERGMSGFEYDPRNPVPTIGGNIDSGKQLVRRGARNQVPIEGEFAATDQLPSLVPLRRALLSDAAPGRGPGDRRSHAGGALGLLHGQGHRLHGEAHGRLSAFVRLSGGVRHEPGRRHPQDAFPRIPGTGRADGAGHRLPGRDRPLGHGEPVPQGAPGPPGHLRQQLSLLRRQSQHGRVPGTPHPLEDGGEQCLPGPGPGLGAGSDRSGMTRPASGKRFGAEPKCYNLVAGETGIMPAHGTFHEVAENRIHAKIHDSIHPEPDGELPAPVGRRRPRLGGARRGQEDDEPPCCHRRIHGHGEDAIRRELQVLPR